MVTPPSAPSHPSPGRFREHPTTHSRRSVGINRVPKGACDTYVTQEIRVHDTTRGLRRAWRCCTRRPRHPLLTTGSSSTGARRGPAPAAWTNCSAHLPSPQDCYCTPFLVRTHGAHAYGCGALVSTCGDSHYPDLRSTPVRILRIVLSVVAVGAVVLWVDAAVHGFSGNYWFLPGWVVLWLAPLVIVAAALTLQVLRRVRPSAH